MTSTPSTAQNWALTHGMTTADLAQLQQFHLPPVPTQPPSRVREFTPRATADWTEAQLEQAIVECAQSGDGPALEALERLLTARENVSKMASGLQDRHTSTAWDDLAHQPAWATSASPLLSPGRRPQSRLTPDQQVRTDYETYVDVQWLAAETDCHGQLLTPAARAAGIDSRSLFSGPITRAQKYASEELQSWWGAHGRLTFAAFRHQALGRHCDAAAAERVRMETFDNALTW